jgi:hypothetical protein
MDIKTAIKICKEHQKWRMEKPPYDGETPEKHRPMPYTAREYGIALDSVLKFAEETIKAQTFFAGLNAAKESFKNLKK